MTKKRFIISTLLALSLIVGSMYFAGLSIWFHWHLPSFIFVILIPYMIASFIFSPKKQLELTNEIFKDREISKNEALKEAITYLTTLRNLMISAAIVGFLLGFMGMMSNLEDTASIGRNLSVALIVLFYSAIYIFVVIEPLIGTAKKNMIK